MATAKQSSAPNVLPDLEDGELATIRSIEVLTRKTRPPTHYTEGLLLDDMQGAAKFVEGDAALQKALKVVSGLGTAATRAAAIEGLKNDKYLEKSGKHLVATAKGLAFIQWLETVMPELTDVAMTARWEAELGLVAQVGGGPAFEARVAEFVKNLITKLKAAPPLGLAPPRPSTLTSKETSRMSDNNEQRASKPSDKMLEFAKNIATKVGVRVPDEVMTSYDACKKFIDDNKDAAMRPSEKQLNFANSIALRKGMNISAEIMANGRDLSAWIDSNK